jgi:hypothetical protein
LEEPAVIGGQRWIYENLIERLQNADITVSAEHLDLALNDAGEVQVLFLGTTFLVSHGGVRRSDGQGFKDATGSDGRPTMTRLLIFSTL